MKKHLHYILPCILALVFLTVNTGIAQKQKLNRVEPPFWWAGMKSQDLQLLVQGDGISTYEVSINYPGVELKKVNKADNPDFLFLDLTISPDAKAGEIDINFSSDKKKKFSHRYKLKEREQGRNAFKGLNQNDVMYLITPDRFANGDLDNDEAEGLVEGKNMEFHSGRHGGDLVGISSKTDYLKDLGITAVWINPVLENNMKEYSYHGYATTDYYNVDARFGTNQEYKDLTDKFHENDIKMIMDMVFNHCGLYHWWMEDMPFKDWIHYYPNEVITNHAKSAFSDPYAAQEDIDLNEKGWFVSVMPDLNQDNPFMANYLLQNSIWWIEYLGLDGIRMDTHPYNKAEFMKEWADRIYQEYPDFYLVGETWVEDEATEAYWAFKSPETKDAFNSGLNSITDFPLCFAIHKAFSKEGNVMELYKVLSKDFLYDDPSMNKIFADNHDMDRYYHIIGEDLDKFKLSMTFLLTTRGIPQIYYGTEMLMRKHGHHGDLREDFPGGWPGDARDAFTSEGRTVEENEAYDHIQQLLKWRKNSTAFANGKLKHFVPYDNVYVYNWKSDKESVVVIINNNNSLHSLNMGRFSEILEGYEGGKDILTGDKIEFSEKLELEANKALLLQLTPQLKTELKK